MNRRRSIRWHLFQLQMVSMVPIGLLAAALLYLHWQVQEHERERSQIESVRLLAAAIDNALDSSVERLSIFARLWSSSSLGERAIYEQAKEALNANADWSDILAFNASGVGVFRAGAARMTTPSAASDFTRPAGAPDADTLGFSLADSRTILVSTPALSSRFTAIAESAPT